METIQRPKFLVDGHIHTLACGHAYNTIEEMARAAKDEGLELICWTEHGPDMFNSAKPMFFRNMRVIPPEIEGVRVLKGIEANIKGPGGKIDARPSFIDHMEVISASLHEGTLKPGTMAENTEIILDAMDNPYIDYFNHLGNPKYPLDYERIIKEAKDKDKLIEINNSSFFVRKGSAENCIKIAELCKKYDVPVILGSDAHHSSAVGKFPYATKTLDIAGIPNELVINTDPQKLLSYLEKKGKPLGVYRADEGLDVFKDYENNETETIEEIEEDVVV